MASRPTVNRRWMVLAAWTIGLTGLASWPVTTRQGINGVVSAQRIPLWVKASEFLARDYHYRQLVRRLLQGQERASDQRKVMVLFRWTASQLRHQPKGWLVVDDHVYSIIVRGYGTADQFADVFTTLCTYAGVPATLVKLMSADRAIRYMGSVRLAGEWCLFDPYWGVYFEHPDGRPVSWRELAGHPALLDSTRHGPSEAPVDEAAFIQGGVSLDSQAIRPYAQMPWMRLLQEFRRWITPWSRVVGHAVMS